MAKVDVADILNRSEEGEMALDTVQYLTSQVTFRPCTLKRKNILSAA